MRNDRSVAANQPSLVLALVGATLALATPAAAPAQEDAHGVEDPLPRMAQKERGRALAPDPTGWLLERKTR
jgi:hypothetical protein